MFKGVDFVFLYGSDVAGSSRYAYMACKGTLYPCFECIFVCWKTVTRAYGPMLWLSYLEQAETYTPTKRGRRSQRRIMNRPDAIRRKKRYAQGASRGIFIGRQAMVDTIERYVPAGLFGQRDER